MRVLLQGATGRLGKIIFEKLQQKQIPCTPVLRQHLQSTAELSALIESINEPFIWLDVSLPEVSANFATQLIQYCSQKQPHFLVGVIFGTTGHKSKDVFLELSKFVALILVSNFSKGVFLFEQILRAETKNGLPLKSLIQNLGFDLSIHEKHHVHKKDSPSGTALTLADAVDCPIAKITSVREGEVVGEHSVILATENETLVLTHLANSRDVFAEGAIDLCERFFHKKPQADFYSKDFFWT